MLREQFNEALKAAMKAGDERAREAVRMAIAEMKKRDIEARAKGNAAGIGDDEIRAMLQALVRSRRESIEMYARGGRQDLADREQAEIAVLERFLPRQLDAAETEAAVRAAIAESGAAGIKDMGKVMALVKQRHAGQLDLAQVGPLARRLLGG